jgi:aspartate/methionine/tyrosine aminotransferase
MRKLAANAKCCVDAIGRIPGLRVEGVPQGALYVMVTIQTGVFTGTANVP